MASKTTLAHSITYGTERDVSVDVIVKSLIANDLLIRESVCILEELFDGLTFQKVEVKLETVSHKSPLKEVFAVGVFFAFQDELESEVPRLIEHFTGLKVTESADTLVTVLVLIIAIYVIDTSTKKLFPNRENSELKREYKEKLTILSDLSDVNLDKLDALINSKISESKSKTLFDKTLDFFAPSKQHSNAPITYPNGMLINTPAIKEVPSGLELSELENRKVYDLDSVYIEIHRADLDFGDKGWLAVVRDVSEERKKIVLPPEITPLQLYGNTKFNGNITVVEEKKDGEIYKLKEYHLRSVNFFDKDS